MSFSHIKDDVLSKQARRQISLLISYDGACKACPNNEVNSQKEMHCVFCLYPRADQTPLISSLTVKCGIGAVSFFGSMQVANSISKVQAINTFYNSPSTVLSTTLTMENYNG